MDGGGHFLKLCLSIFEIKEDEIGENLEMPIKKRRRSIKTDFLCTGVKKSFIIAIGENISENYDNIQKIFSAIENFDSIKFFMCNDLKATAIIMGIQNANAIFPCPICEVNDLGINHDHTKNHELRTLSSIITNATNFKQSNCKRSEARKYKSQL